ncbi:conserved hypothetical protein [Ricinus communis]|uniref:DUF4216 domain-containing protein n=1 Tax=Ricinus communis TaxID=3988 RepID=B9T1I0_RICCO|nr:conserved hypothetical protein [Ricinus communis]
MEDNNILNDYVEYKEELTLVDPKNKDQRHKSNSFNDLKATCQANQAYYVKDILNPNWHLVVRVKPQNYYDLPLQFVDIEEHDRPIDLEPYQDNELATIEPYSTIYEHDDLCALCRDDIGGSYIDENFMIKEQKLIDGDETQIQTQMIMFYNSKKKRKRVYKKIAIARKVKSIGVKLLVLIRETKLRAVSISAKNFISGLGVKVRQNAPLNVKRWTKVPESVKVKIVVFRREYFIFNDLKNVENAIYLAASDLYRTWCARLHKHYQKFETNEESLRNYHRDSTDEVWKEVVEYFGTKEFKQEETGKELDAVDL